MLVSKLIEKLQKTYDKVGDRYVMIKTDGGWTPLLPLKISSKNKDYPELIIIETDNPD